MSNVIVEISRARYSRGTKICSAVVFSATAFLDGWLCHYMSAFGSVGALPGVCLLALAVAAVLLFPKPRLAHLVASLAGMVGLYWFFRIELANFPALNSWIALNLPDTPDLIGSLKEAELRLALGTALIFLTVWTLIALLPADWRISRRPARERVWLTIVVALVGMTFWFFRSISPYRLPIIADGPAPTLAILHVEKNRISFRETRISVYRNGDYYYSRHERKLFRYRFPEQGGNGTLSLSLSAEVKALADSSPIKNSRTDSVRSLRAWRAEGWYFSAGNKRKVSAFTTENRAEPPKELVDLFRKLIGSVAAEKRIPDAKDVCLGFCYDPFAALGLANLNDRCLYDNGTRCE